MNDFIEDFVLFKVGTQIPAYGFIYHMLPHHILLAYKMPAGVSLYGIFCVLNDSLQKSHIFCGINHIFIKKHFLIN